MEPITPGRHRAAVPRQPTLGFKKNIILLLQIDLAKDKKERVNIKIDK